MLEENKREFEICNILRWHELGYTGKGIKIAELESFNPNAYFVKGKIKDPLGRTADGKGSKHGTQVFDIMIQVAPEAEYISLSDSKRIGMDGASGDFFEKTIPYIIENKVHLVGASLGGSKHEEITKAINKAKEAGAIFVTSAGNDGEDGLGNYAESGDWISVGALGYNDEEKDIYLKSYSSRGEELDVVVFSGLYIHPEHETGKPFKQEGTSFSSPMLIGMLSLVQQFFLEKLSRTLYQEEIMKFIQDHVIDLGESGHDELYGHGLFVLPEPSNIQIERYVEVENIKPSEFIELVKPGAIESYCKYNILPSVTIAQAALESGWGKYHIQNNLFGIKWTEGCGFDKVARQTKEYVNGEYINVTAYFRGYKNFSESVLDHAKVLAQARYTPVRHAKDYKEAASALQVCGYATDPKYAEKLISIIESYALDELDKEVREVKKDYEGHWAEKEIKKAIEKGIITGYPDGKWKPDHAVLRAELVVILDRLGLLE